MFKNIKEPTLSPDTNVPYLRFTRDPGDEVVEVHFPDHVSYLVDWVELETFLKLSGIATVDMVTAHIKNFNNVMWIRKENRVFHVPRERLIIEDDAVLI